MSIENGIIYGIGLIVSGIIGATLGDSIEKRDPAWITIGIGFAVAVYSVIVIFS